MYNLQKPGLSDCGFGYTSGLGTFVLLGFIYFFLGRHKLLTEGICICKDRGRNTVELALTLVQAATTAPFWPASSVNEVMHRWGGWTLQKRPPPT